MFFLTVFIIGVAFATAALPDAEHLRTIYQFPNGTWVENIAIRPNGKLLVTLVNKPELWEIDPFSSDVDSRAKLVHHFHGAEMCNGITELTKDVFAVIASNRIWELAYSSRNDSQYSIKNVTEIAGGTLNGMTTLDRGRGIVLIADSELGLVWRLDTREKTYRVVLQDETMSARPGRRTLIGINGIKVVDDYVYYNNCPGRLYCRVQINLNSSVAVGSYETIATGALADDLAVTANGVGYLAGLDDNVIRKIWLNGTQQIIAGSYNSTALVGPTAAAFGRTWRDKDVLYITTSGGTAAPLNGTYVEGGKVAALSL